MPRSIIIKILLLIIFMSFAIPAYAGLSVNIEAHATIYDDFMKWTKYTPVQLISRYNTRYTDNKEVILLILLCQALYISYNDVSLNIKPVLNYKRAYNNAQNGVIHIPAQTYLKKKINRRLFYISLPVIEKGVHEKGIYTTEKNNKKFENIQSVEDMKPFTAVILNEWESGWDTLKGMKIKNIIPVKNISLQYDKLVKDKADFTILDFSKNNDLSIEYEKTLLIPVKNIKIGIKASYHFIISKTSENGLKIYLALQKGIKILKEKGTIDKALTESGLKDYRVKNWKRIF